MSKSNVCENSLLLLIFNNTAFAGVGDAGGLLPSAAAGNLYVSLHTSDPGEAGDQTTNEIAYTDYARRPVARAAGAGGFTVTDNSVSTTDDVGFAESAGGAGGTVSHFAIGTAVSGAGKRLYSGTVTPNIVVSSGVAPKIKNTSTITEE